MPITREQQDALRLIESGMSQRKAAKTLGISRAALRWRHDFWRGLHVIKRIPYLVHDAWQIINRWL